MRRHWRRFFLQVSILVIMVAVNAIDEKLLVLLVALALVAAPAATWTVFGILLWLSVKAPEIDSLSDRVDDALSAAMGSTVAAGIGVLVLLRLASVITTPLGSLVTVGLAFVVVTVSIPSISLLPVVRDVWLPRVRAREARAVSRAGQSSGRGSPEP